MTASHYILPKLKNIPGDILTGRDYQSWAQQFLPEDIFAHIAGGTAHEQTLQSNRAALGNLGFMPKALVKFNNSSTHCQLLGRQHALPFMLAPIAYHQLAHPEGELACVDACNAMKTGMICSTLSSIPLENIQQHSEQPLWFQLYFQTTKEKTLDLVKRAEHAGFEALVITIDAPVTGMRYRAQRAGFAMPSTVSAANFANQEEAQTVLLQPEQSIILDGIMASAPTWESIQWLQQNTSLPILIKGIINAEDAKHCQEMGLAGIIVSNHGGRAIDGLPASIDMITPIRQAVGPDFLLLLDGGIESGGDAFKALALGANAVLIGRLHMYALSVAGALGVAHLIRLFKEELELTMALTGCPNLEHITPQRIHPFK